MIEIFSSYLLDSFHLNLVFRAPFQSSNPLLSSYHFSLPLFIPTHFAFFKPSHLSLFSLNKARVPSRFHIYPNISLSLLAFHHLFLFLFTCPVFTFLTSSHKSSILFFFLCVHFNSLCFTYILPFPYVTTSQLSTKCNGCHLSKYKSAPEYSFAHSRSISVSGRVVENIVIKSYYR